MGTSNKHPGRKRLKPPSKAPTRSPDRSRRHSHPIARGGEQANEDGKPSAEMSLLPPLQGEPHRNEPLVMDPMWFHPRRPGRPPDWRWGWATALVDGLVPPSQLRDDAWIMAAVRFLSTLRRCRDEVDHEALTEQMPDLYAAHSIYTGEPHRRWAIEARLLAGERFESIGAKHGASAAAIAAYEGLFFDVLAHKSRIDYIATIVIGLHRGPAPPDLGVVWRWFGFIGGPLVLDFLLGTHPEVDRPGTFEGVGGFLAQDARDELLRKLAVAAFMLPVEGHTATKWLRIYFRILKGERKAQEAATTIESIMPNVIAMRDGLPSFMKGVEELPPPAALPALSGIDAVLR
jgi:hypothetical protein